MFVIDRTPLDIFEDNVAGALNNSVFQAISEVLFSSRG